MGVPGARRNDPGRGFPAGLDTRACDEGAGGPVGAAFAYAATQDAEAVKNVYIGQVQSSLDGNVHS